MHRSLHDRLAKETNALRAELALLSTGDAIRTCAAYLLFAHSSESEARLTSPPRQVAFLLGLLLATPEPERPEPFDAWPKARACLNRIFQTYIDMYVVGVEATSASQKEATQVAACAFLHYFNQGHLVSVEQQELLYGQLLGPFDAYLREELGISASETLRVIKAIEARLQEQSRRSVSLRDEELSMRTTLLDEAQGSGWSLADIRRQARDRGYAKKVRSLWTSIDDILSVRLPDICDDVGREIAHAFWHHFTIRRGAVSDLAYPTAENEVDYRPVVLLSPDVGICLNLNTVYSAPYRSLERILERSPRRQAFFDLRSRVLESRLVSAVGTFFGANASVLHSVVEATKVRQEHDLVVLWQRRLLVFEAKSRPPREPLRDPDRAFIRVRDDFRSDTGIQGAFEQANHLRTRWRAGETIQLSDKRGAIVATIAPADVDHVHMVCVTGDDFGPLAVDLSLLLQKDAETPFPWAVNINDLETLLQGWSHRNWGPTEFCTYLEERSRLHGKLSVDDELDVAGFFLRHGSLVRLISAPADKIVLSLNCSSIFDDIAVAKRGGPPVDFTDGEPLAADLRELLGVPGARVGPRPWRGEKVGRNAPCPCGSGMKFKKCCGRLHRRAAGEA